MIQAEIKHVTFTLSAHALPTELTDQLYYQIINFIIYITKIYNVFLMYM